MARTARRRSATDVYHVTVRGTGKIALFHDDHDRQLFLHLLARVVRQFDWRLYDYCIMGNHVHLLIDAELEQLSAGMHRLFTGFAQHFNRKYGRVGHLVQNRFKSEPVERDGHAMAVSPYIALNPVRAGICDHPGDYAWSGFRAIAGRRKPPRWHTVSWVRSWLAEDPAEAAQRYVAVCERMLAPPATKEGGA
jgi:REP element-mobilizing transposase RayT